MYYFLVIILVGIVVWLWLREKPESFNLISKQEGRLKKGIEHLKKNKTITNTQYRELTGVSAIQAVRDFDVLEKKGLVEQVGKTGKYTKYRKK